MRNANPSYAKLSKVARPSPIWYRALRCKGPFTKYPRPIRMKRVEKIAFTIREEETDDLIAGRSSNRPPGVQGERTIKIGLYFWPKLPVKSCQ